MWAITLDKILEPYAVRRFSVSDSGKSAMQERLKLAIHTKSVVAVYAKP
jgi:hypothetical protein